MEGILIGILSLIITFGIFAQIALGFIQPIAAVVLYGCLKRKDSKEGIDLIRYLLLTMTYLTIFFQFPSFEGPLIFIFYFFIPWVFAVWFFMNRRHHRRRNRRIKGYDRDQKLKSLEYERKEIFKPVVLKKEHLFAS